MAVALLLLRFVFELSVDLLTEALEEELLGGANEKSARISVLGDDV